jgi:hypothetical protein
MSSEPGSESFFCGLRPILRILSLWQTLTRVKPGAEEGYSTRSARVGEMEAALAAGMRAARNAQTASAAAATVSA